MNDINRWSGADEADGTDCAGRVRKRTARTRIEPIACRYENRTIVKFALLENVVLFLLYLHCIQIVLPYVPELSLKGAIIVSFYQYFQRMQHY